MKKYHSILDGARDFFQLFFPNNCPGCGKPLFRGEEFICMYCVHKIPETGFHQLIENPVYKVFHGRFPLEFASSYGFFTKRSVLQRLLHQLKYKEKKEVGWHLGKLYGSRLMEEESLLPAVDLMVPMPLHISRYRSRGYNQSTEIANGLSEIMDVPVEKRAVRRRRRTKSQTGFDRQQRWQNVAGSFELRKPERLSGKHILLIDDVLTTGASLEALALELLKVDGVKISIVTIGFPWK